MHPATGAQNCLREIRSSLEQNKPLVLVHEANPSKGGGTIEASPTALLGRPAGGPLAHASKPRLSPQELRAECPEELQPDIFDRARSPAWPLIVWHL